MTALADGDLRVRLEPAFAPDDEKLRGDFNSASAKLQGSLAVISGATEIINQMVQVTQQNAAMVEPSTAASRNPATEADDGARRRRAETRTPTGGELGRVLAARQGPRLDSIPSTKPPAFTAGGFRLCGRGSQDVQHGMRLRLRFAPHAQG